MSLPLIQINSKCEVNNIHSFLLRYLLGILNTNINYVFQWRSYSSAKAFLDALEKSMMCDYALEFSKLFALFWICAHIYNIDPFSGI